MKVSALRFHLRLFLFVGFVGTISNWHCAFAAEVAITQPAQREGKSTTVFFSPHGGYTEAIVEALRGAKATVRVQAYSFTSAPIAEAVVAAHRRGVNVQVILDKSQRTERYSSATFLSNAGVPTFIDAKHAIAHNKVMVIDGRR